MYILYSVQWGVLLARPAAKVPAITDSGYHTVKKKLVTSRLAVFYVFFGLSDPDPDPLVRGMDPDPDPARDPDPDPSIIMQK